VCVSRYLRALALCGVLASLSTCAGAATQISYPDHPRLTVQRLEEEFGLGAVTVTTMGQDAEGFLWIGTQTGLYRYDGARARKMTEVEAITGHYLVDMVIAPDGTPWFAGNRGIAHYRNGQFEALAIPGSAMPLATGCQILAVDSQGVVFALLFNHGILRIDPDHPSRARVLGEEAGIKENPVGIVRGEDDNVWFTTGTHLAHVSALSTKAEIDSRIRIPRERVVALVIDGTRTMWLRTATKLARLEPNDHTITMESIAIGPTDEEEGKPSLDHHGRLLVPTSTGLYWHDNGHWRVITDKQGLTSNDIQFALEDREGTLWVAGSGTGLDRLPGVQEWSNWTTAEGLPDNTTWATLRDHKGRLWVSTARGIAVWDGQSHRWRKVGSPSGHSRSEVRQIQLAGDGTVWALTVTGAILRVDPNDFSTTMQASYWGRPFQMIYAAPDGKIWATSRQHVLRFDAWRPNEIPTDFPLPDTAGNELTFLSFSPDGGLWAASTGEVCRFEGNHWRIVAAKDGLRGQAITSLYALSQQEAWVAYNDVVAVSRVLVQENGSAKLEHFNWDLFIVGRDSQKRLWFDGTDGLMILSPDGRQQNINHAAGLVWDDVSPWTGVREESDGSFVVATSRGLALYRPGAATQAGKRTNVLLTSVSLGGRGRRVNEDPVVRPSEGALTVEFTPLVLDNPERVSCLYQLRGLEKQVNETHLREARYGGLPAGDYEFWVQCQDPGSRIASAPATFKFRVLPYPWQTWWARLVGGVLLLGCFWGFVSLRTRALVRRRLELEQAVEQRNAELIEKNKELEEISLTDPLTATRNRRYFYETISTDIAQALRSHLQTLDQDSTPAPRQDLIFAFVDIDRFKRVNDELGHAAGDKLLQEVAKRIESVKRRTDDLVRWGGEEFLLVCRTTDRENAPMLFARVLAAIREVPFDVGNGVEVHKTCSIGWAPFPWLKDDVRHLSIENVIELADKALYMAKREGRNRSVGLVPAAKVFNSAKSITIENLRDCPPNLVQIV
jgi:diguanylate cyclase (GGDEF)-like protein